MLNVAGGLYISVVWLFDVVATDAYWEIYLHWHDTGGEILCDLTVVAGPALWENHRLLPELAAFDGKILNPVIF